jgi:E3 ubiquitin-protein ligase SHPRH
MAKLYNGRLKCSVCRHQQLYKNVYFVTCSSTTSVPTVLGNFSNKIVTIVETVLDLRKADPNVKIIIFSQWETILSVVADALKENSILFRSKSPKFHACIEAFQDAREKVTCLLMPLRFGSKGLNLTMATHVFLVEPILDPGEELQAIGRVHRIGQTRETFVHRFIVRETIEQTIFETIVGDKTESWKSKDVTVENLQQLFDLPTE